MKKLDEKTLALLSLLVIPGVLSMSLFPDSIIKIIPILMCLIGGLSFGLLIKLK
jgi:xanthine/uracil permease